jgi:acylphosphatase
MNTQLHAIIEGHVQGVGFRYFVLERAQALSLTGWVRNTYDGQVEVLAQGPRSDLEKLLEDLQRGPRSSFVTEVRTTWSTSPSSYPRFQILPTA